MVVKKIYWHGHVSFFCQKIPGKKICSTAAHRSQKNAFCFQQKTFFSFRNFCPGCRIRKAVAISCRLSFPEVLVCLYRNHCRAVGCPLLYSCRTLSGRPHKNPPMGSRSAAFNADCREPAAVAKEKAVFIPVNIFN